MAGIDWDQSVPDWLIDHPELLSLFQQFEIDYCCGGKSLRVACGERSLDLQEFEVLIRQQIESNDFT